MTKIHRINYIELPSLRDRVTNSEDYDFISEVDREILCQLLDAAIYRDTLEIYNRPQNV